MKGLDDTESGNRVRFQKLSQRLKKIHVDVVHRVKAQTNTIDSWKYATPDSGIAGCHFQDELENCKDLCSTSIFKR